jgi:glycosyltransferase involved in cell wall biosynthesis
MNIKLSIIIPTYNRSEYLYQCIKSVLSNNYQNMEVLVSDNASQDNTKNVVFSFNDQRLQYFRNDTNIGAEFNILKLLGYASGDYLFCLGDDDYLNEGAISEIVDIISQYPNVGVILNALKRLDSQTGQSIEDYVPYPASRLYNSGEESLMSLLWIAQSFPTITIRRDLLDIDGAKRHVDSMYPQVYLVGKAMKNTPTYYTNKRLVTARLFAKRWWEYKDDYQMLVTKIGIITDLLPQQNEKHLQNMLIGSLIRKNIGYFLFKPNSGRIPIKICLRQTMSLISIPEVRKPKIFWGDFILGICIVIANTFIAMILKIKRKIVSYIN